MSSAVIKELFGEGEEGSEEEESDNEDESEEEEGDGLLSDIFEEGWEEKEERKRKRENSRALMNKLFGDSEEEEEDLEDEEVDVEEELLCDTFEWQEDERMRRKENRRKKEEEEESTSTSSFLLDEITLGRLLGPLDLVECPNYRAPTEPERDAEWVQDWYEFEGTNDEEDAVDTDTVHPCWVLRIELNEGYFEESNRHFLPEYQPTMQVIKDAIISLSKPQSAPSLDIIHTGYDCAGFHAFRLRCCGPLCKDESYRLLQSLKESLQDSQNTLLYQILDHINAPRMDWERFERRLDSNPSDAECVVLFHFQDTPVETSVLHEVCSLCEDWFPNTPIPLSIFQKLLQATPKTVYSTPCPPRWSYRNLRYRSRQCFDTPPFNRYTPLYGLLNNLAQGISDITLPHVEALLEACPEAASTISIFVPKSSCDGVVTCHTPVERYPIHAISNMVTLYQSWPHLSKKYTVERVTAIEAVFPLVLRHTPQFVLLQRPHDLAEAYPNDSTATCLLCESYHNKSVSESKAGNPMSNNSGWGANDPELERASARVKAILIPCLDALLRATIRARRECEGAYKGGDIDSWILHEVLSPEHNPKAGESHRFHYMIALLRLAPPSALLQRDHGQIPLHRAIRYQYPWKSCIQPLLEAHPPSACVREQRGGMYPFMLMAAHGKPYLFYDIKTRTRKEHSDADVLNSVYTLLRKCSEQLAHSLSPFSDCSKSSNGSITPLKRKHD